MSSMKNEPTDSKGWTSPFSFLQNLRRTSAAKQQVVSITYEEIGLFPRSFNRVFDRFFKQLFFDVDNLVIQEYRFYRYLFLTTVRCLMILFLVPFTVNFIAKNYFIQPVIEYYWNTNQSEIFINSYQQKQAFSELHSFEEKLYFESFLGSSTLNFEPFATETPLGTVEMEENAQDPAFVQETQRQLIQKRLQKKTLELAHHYNDESIESITNFFADALSFSTLFALILRLEVQINITKSFLLEVFFGLDDSKKSLFILFTTDLLVGYHSPNIWELFFQSIFDHYGLPESQTTIFLLVPRCLYY